MHLNNERWSNTQQCLCHYGVKGMRWGVRKSKLRISKKEYGHVLHELMTNMTTEQRGQKFVSKYIGDYLYKFRKEAEGIYDVIGKERSLDILDKLSRKKR